MQSFQTVPNVLFFDQAPFYESKKIAALLQFFSYLSLHFLFLGLFVKSGNKEVNKKRERDPSLATWASCGPFGPRLPTAQLALTLANP